MREHVGHNVMVIQGYWMVYGQLEQDGMGRLHGGYMISLYDNSKLGGRWLKLRFGARAIADIDEDGTVFLQ